MKKRFLKPLTYGMALMALVSISSCSDDNDPKQPDTSGQQTEAKPFEGTLIDDDITSSVILESGKEYTLRGGVHVKAPATLVIEPGVKIVAEDLGTSNVTYILVEQGAKIDAEGTADKPIVMTCERKEAGAWGGLHICGRAPINLESVGKSEIGNADFGGTDAADNSGKLKYVRLEYTGVSLNEETESNGLTLYGVGNGTEISYIQAYKGADDGIEFFGGTVNVDHCVVIDCTDDSYDWTYGWSGEGKYLVAYQEPKEIVGEDCDCLIEADNNGDNNTLTPVSHPVLSNLTLVGNNSSVNKRGIRLREGTQVTLSNCQVTGKSKPLTVESKETDEALANGVSTITNVALSGVFTNEYEGGKYTNEKFLSNGNLENQNIILTDRFVGMTDGRGAVEATNMWMSGWTL